MARASLSRPVIITGPQGCGKTLHASTLAQAVGCDHVVDGWHNTGPEPLTLGALHLTNEPAETLVLAYGDRAVIREYADVAMSCGLIPDPSDAAVFSAGEYLSRADHAAAPPPKRTRRKGGAA